MNPEIRELADEVASKTNIGLAELGRRALVRYLKAEIKRLRREEFRLACDAYADVVTEVQYEWRHTEVEGWPE
jgi:hypothetical protein